MTDELRGLARVRHDRGWRTFLVIWLGQMVSLLGTGMTRFALLIWAYQQTGAATTVALLGFFSFMPFVVLGPVAGAVVDRVNRRFVMIAADTGAGLLTVLLMVLLRQDNLAIWHLYAVAGLAGTFEAFQNPAYSAATTMLVAPRDYSRVNGLRGLADSVSQVGAPALAGLVLVGFGLVGVLWVDVVTFLFAVGTLLVVRIPEPRHDEAEHAPSHWRADLLYGLRFIRHRPGLIGLLMVVMGMNLFGTLTYMSILPAMILARGGGELGWATVQTALGLGAVVGSLLASTWGGPKRRIHAVYGGAALSFLFGDWLLALGRTVPVWAVAGFVAAFFIPLFMANNTSIWQAKTPPAVQGRVFAAKNMLQLAPMPVAYLVAGPLADYLFDPLMNTPGPVQSLFAPLIGTGPGSGIALMFLGTGLLGTLVCLAGYAWPAARRVEIDLPDHAAVPGEPQATPIALSA